MNSDIHRWIKQASVRELAHALAATRGSTYKAVRAEYEKRRAAEERSELAALGVPTAAHPPLSALLAGNASQRPSAPRSAPRPSPKAPPTRRAPHKARQAPSRKPKKDQPTTEGKAGHTTNAPKEGA